MLVSLCSTTLAQSSSSSLSGKVTDQTGAVIPQATVTVTGADGKPTSAATDQAGAFSIHGLLPGTYTVAASAQGFAPFKKEGVVFSPGQTQALNLALQIQ